MLWKSSLTLVVYFPEMYTLIMRLTHELPELAQYLGGSKRKYGKEEVLDCTKLKVYRDIVLTSLVCTCETWTVYYCQETELLPFELNCQAFKLCFKEHNSSGLVTLF